TAATTSGIPATREENDAHQPRADPRHAGVLGDRHRHLHRRLSGGGEAPALQPRQGAGGGSEHRRRRLDGLGDDRPRAHHRQRHPRLKMRTPLLFVTVLVIAACGLVYELVAGALASYLLGDSVLQFSTVIGAYLFAMGVGSWLSRFFERQLPAHFLRIELLVALVGGFLPALLFLANAYLPNGF